MENDDTWTEHKTLKWKENLDEKKDRKKRSKESIGQEKEEEKVGTIIRWRFSANKNDYVSLSIVVQLTTLVYIFGVNRRHANNFVAQKSLRRRCACVPRQSLDGIAQCAKNGNLVLYKNLRTACPLSCSRSAVNLRNRLTYIVHFCVF